MTRREKTAGVEPTKVVHFLRSRDDGGFSLERMFADIRGALPADIAATLVTSPHANVGWLARIENAWNARRHRAQVNHVLGDTQYLASFLPRQNTVITIHDCVSLERLTGLRRALVWLSNYWWPLKRAAQVVVVSEFTRRSVHRWVRYPDERIVTIPPPLSGEFVPAPLPELRSPARVLHIGVAPNKNLLRVAEALVGLKIELDIVGRLSDEQRRNLALHAIRFTEHHELSREQVVERYRQADVLLFASTYEGFGMPIIEAQAIGRPVVTSDVAAMPEAAGDAACLVDPFDPASIRAGLLRVLEDADYRAQLIVAGRTNAEKYTAERIAEAYAQVYRRLATR